MATSSVPVWIYKLLIPKTQKLSFETIFKNVEKDSQDLFGKLSQQREEVRSFLEVDSKEAALLSIEKYTPGFFGLMIAAEALPPDFSKWLRIIWTTPIGVRYSTNPFVYSGFRFEVVMMLLAYGILHRNIAHDQLQSANFGSSDFDEKSKAIANHLCRAAGVFEHIRDQQLSSWKVKPDVQFPEITDELYLSLSDICIAEAQEITVKKGLLKGTSAGALAKLCVDIYQKYEHALSLLRSMPSHENVLPPLVNYVAINTAMWKAISFRLIAEDNYAKGSYGVAVAYARQAASSIPERPKDALLESVLNLYNEERATCKAMAEKYGNENDSIYYEKVPMDAPLPEAKCLMKVVPFEPPTPQQIQIVQTKGMECLIQ